MECHLLWRTGTSKAAWWKKAASASSPAVPAPSLSEWSAGDIPQQSSWDPALLCCPFLWVTFLFLGEKGWGLAWTLGYFLLLFSCEGCIPDSASHWTSAEKKKITLGPEGEKERSHLPCEVMTWMLHPRRWEEQMVKGLGVMGELELLDFQKNGWITGQNHSLPGKIMRNNHTALAEFKGIGQGPSSAPQTRPRWYHGWATLLRIQGRTSLCRIKQWVVVYDWLQEIRA